jgi:hypothetical protein
MIVFKIIVHRTLRKNADETLSFLCQTILTSSPAVIIHSYSVRTTKNQSKLVYCTAEFCTIHTCAGIVDIFFVHAGREIRRSR